MRPPESLRAVAILATCIACLLPAAGCGGGKSKKGGGLTIAQRLEKARAEATPESQARELVKVARLQSRSSDNSGAAKTLSEARALLTPKPPQPPPRKEPSPETVAPEQAAEGDAAPAGGAAPGETPPPADAAAAPSAEPPAEPAPPAEPEKVIDPLLAGPTLVEIAAVYALVGERSTAKDTLSQVNKLLEKIDDAVVKTRMLAEAGGIYGAKTGGLGDAANARRTLAKAVTLSEQIDERFRPEALAAITTGYVTAGLAKDAADTVAKLETLARSADPRPKAEGLAVAATVRGQTGDTDGAKDLLAEAGEAAKSIDGAENRAYALLSVARATSGVGDRKGALGLVKAAEKSAQKVGDPEAQKTALEKVRAVEIEIEKRK